MFKEVYVQVCKLLGCRPSKRVLSQSHYEEKMLALSLEECEISPIDIKAVTYAIYSLGSSRIYKLSFASNFPHFSDDCLRSVSDILPELTLLRSLDLSKVNVSD